MKRTFIYSDEKSNKFWSIEANGKSYTVKYGKVGTDGQTQTKEFSDEAACLAAVEKAISGKTGKGYAEQTDGLSAAPEVTTKIEKSAQEPGSASVAKKEQISEEAQPKTTGDRDHRRFVYRDGLTHKFWNIERQGLEVFISFGAWGKKPRTNSKSYESEERAAKEMIKSLNKKASEGYMEITPGAVPIPDISEPVAYEPLPLDIRDFWIDIYDFSYSIKEVEDRVREYISWGRLGEVPEEQIAATIDAIAKNREKLLQIRLIAADLHEQNIAIFTPELVKKPKKVDPIVAPKGGKITKKLIKQMTDAIQEERVDDVRTMVGFGVTGNHNDNIVFYYAIASKNPEIIRMIVPTMTDYTVECGCLRDYHKTTTSAVLESDDYDLVKTILEAGYDLKKDPYFFENIGRVRDTKLADLIFSIRPLSEDTEGKAMIAALDSYNEELVAYLLDHKANLAGYDNASGNYVMHYVLDPFKPYCNLETVKRFVEQGASLNVTNIGELDWYETDKKPRTGGGETPLMKALSGSKYDYEPKLPKEIEEYVRQTDQSEVTAEQAFRAAREGRLPILKEFIEKNGTDVRDENGATLLHHIMLQQDNTQNCVCADYVLSQGADVNAIDKNGRTALFYVDLFTDYHGGANIIKLLADRGADLNHEDKDGLTPIMFHTTTRPERPTNETDENMLGSSIYSGRAFALKSLTRVGADLNRTFKDGKNIFHYLLTLPTFFEDDDIIEMMMKRGGDVNKKDDRSRSALHYATVHNYCGVDDRVTRYVKYGKADLNSRDESGNTPLHTLLIEKDRYSISNLIRHGANPTIPNNEGKTAEDLMRELGNYDRFSDVLAEYHAAPPETRIIEHKWKPVEIKTPQTKFDRLNLEITGSLLLPNHGHGEADHLFTAGKNRLIGRDLHNRYTCINTMTGEIMWQEQSYAGHDYAFYSERDDVLYSGHNNKEVAAVDPQTGEILWTAYVANSHYTFESPFTEYKNLLVFHSRNSVYGVNKDTHKVQWKVKLKGRLGRRKDNVRNNYYIIQNEDGNTPCFYLVNMDTGLVEHTYRAEKGYKDWSSGYVVGDKLWYISDDGSVCRLNLETGVQEDVTLATKYVHNPKSLVVSGFNYVNGKFYFDIHLIHHDGEEDGMYVCSEDMKIERVASSMGSWLFSKSQLHGSILYYTLPGKIISLSLDDFTEEVMDVPTFSGMDIVDSNLCIHDNVMFIAQSGGNENEDRQIIWIIE